MLTVHCVSPSLIKQLLVNRGSAAVAVGNAFIIKGSQGDPSVPIRLAQLALEARLPSGILSVVNCGKQVVDGTKTPSIWRWTVHAAMEQLS